MNENATTAECTMLVNHEPKVKMLEYLTTKEAAEYLRRSTSWLLRQPEMPYVKGVPNLYKRSDLDAWFARNKFTQRSE